MCSNEARRKQLVVSKLLEDGTYRPGRMRLIRQENTEKAFATRGSLKEKILEHSASRKYKEEEFLGFDDELSDGFRGRFSTEVILLDARVDSKLLGFADWILDQLPYGDGDAEDRVKRLSRLVSDALGGPGHSTLKEEMLQRIGSVTSGLTSDCLIGDLLRDRNAFKGAGLCRHRSFLLKYICDKFGYAKVACVTGVMMATPQMGEPVDVMEFRHKRPCDHMWNVVLINRRTYLVDAMLSPGELLDPESYAIKWYHRLNGHAGVKSLAPPPNSLENDEEALFDGQMPYSDSDEDEDKDDSVNDEGDADNYRKSLRSSETRATRCEEKKSTFSNVEVFSASVGAWFRADEWSRKDDEFTVLFQVPGKGLCKKVLLNDSHSLRFC